MKRRISTLALATFAVATQTAAAAIPCDGISATVTIRTLATQSVDATTVARALGERLLSISSMPLRSDQPLPCDEDDLACARLRVFIDPAYASEFEVTGFDVAKLLLTMKPDTQAEPDDGHWPITRVEACVQDR